MATGMVLIIVSRNIDLSVGSMLGFVGLHDGHGPGDLDPRHPRTRVRPAVHLDHRPRRRASPSVRSSAASRASSSPTSASRPSSSPSAASSSGAASSSRYAQGQTIAPLDTTFQLLGGGPDRVGSARSASWVVGARSPASRSSVLADRQPAAAPALRLPASGRCGPRSPLGGGRRASRCSGAVWVANSYSWPEALAAQYAAEHDITEPPGGLHHPRPGSPSRSLILIGVAVVMTFIADAPAVRPLRLRHRRQPGGGRARRASTPAGRSC